VWTNLMAMSDCDGFMTEIERFAKGKAFWVTGNV
jgi:hypothetical protein